jgi:hypothetical protein
MQEALCPILAFFDIAAAFTSLFHSWMFLALEACGAPSGLYQLVQAMYTCISTSTVIDGRKFFLYWIWSGVLQGCPLSGMLFAISLDPLLRKFLAEVETNGKAAVRACADDIGGALKSITTLKIMKGTLDMAERLTNLTLKPQKCVLVPLMQNISEELVALIKGWLVRELPDWKDFTVKGCSLYLGFHLGPAAGVVQYDRVVRKFMMRANKIADTHSSAAVSAHLYNTRVVPVVTYLTQLTMPPNKSSPSSARPFYTSCTCPQTR